MTYNIYSVKLPLEGDMSKTQLNLLENYKNIYQELSKTPNNRQLINAALKILIKIYELFSAKLQNKYQYWYKFQISVIDPLIAPCAKISDLILQCELKDEVMLSQDGQAILVPVSEDSFASTKFLKLLNQEFPRVQLQKVKIG